MKSSLKSILRAVAVVTVSPLLVSHALLSCLATRDSSLETHSQILSLLPGTWGSYVRVAFYRFVLDHCDSSATIAFGTLFSKTAARIDANVYIGPRCMLGWVTLEQDVLLGPAVQIPSGPHTHGTRSLDQPIRTQLGNPHCVTIGRDSWIGAASIILANVGEQCVIGAASVVTKPIQPQSIATGSPATVIRSRRPANVTEPNTSVKIETITL